MAVDQSGNVIVADRGNYCIRKITPGGLVTTLAGNRTAGFADGVDSLAKFRDPNGVAVEYQNNIYVSDNANRRIRKISPDGNVSTLAGDGNSGYVDGPPATAEFNQPVALTSDSQGNIYVCDIGNARIRKITFQ